MLQDDNNFVILLTEICGCSRSNEFDLFPIQFNHTIFSLIDSKKVNFGGHGRDPEGVGIKSLAPTPGKGEFVAVAYFFQHFYNFLRCFLFKNRVQGKPSLSETPYFHSYLKFHTCESLGVRPYRFSCDHSYKDG